MCLKSTHFEFSLPLVLKGKADLQTSNVPQQVQVHVYITHLLSGSESV